MFNFIKYNNRSFSKSLITTDISSSRKHQVDHHPCQHLALLGSFFFFANLVDVKLYLIKVLICIFLHPNKDKYLFICLWA